MEIWANEEVVWLEMYEDLEVNPIIQGLSSSGEPSLWRNEQQGIETVRYMYIMNGVFVVIRVEFFAETATLFAKVLRHESFESLEISESSEIELTVDQTNQLRELFQIEDLLKTCVFEPMAWELEYLDASW